MKQTVLVVIDTRALTFTRYAGDKLTHMFQFHAMLSPFWIEEIRNDPQQFETQPEAPVEVPPT